MSNALHSPCIFAAASQAGSGCRAVLLPCLLELGAQSWCRTKAMPNIADTVWQVYEHSDVAWAAQGHIYRENGQRKMFDADDLEYTCPKCWEGLSLREYRE